MNEVSTVTGLIMRLIGFAIALGAAGTLVDGVWDSKDLAKNAMTKQMSYLEWNKRLQVPDFDKKR